MNVLILGSGGREHALADAIHRSEQLDRLFVMPGNPGMASIATLAEGDPLDNDLVRRFVVDNHIDLIIPGSEVYLQNGISDALADLEAIVFGPTRKAAAIESSKRYAKDLMRRHGIPTAHYAVFDDYDEAVACVVQHGTPIVIKYDGLAGGKGVVVALHETQAIAALDKMLRKRIYGTDPVVIEEYLEGPEFSLMCFVAGDILIPMPIAQDHKRLLDGDLGPNTGGMGIYSGVPIIPDGVVDEAMETIMRPTVKALAADGRPYVGFLYGGLMHTKDGPKVIEFNARFGDPEAEVILPRLKSDLIDVIVAITSGHTPRVQWDASYTVGVVMASDGYPGSYDKHIPIHGLNKIEGFVFHMGTAIRHGQLVTNGGRVLLVVGRAETLPRAVQQAYDNVAKITCASLIYRRDIAHQSLKR